MRVPGKRVQVPKWIHGRLCVLHTEVEAVIPDADPSEPCLEPDVLEHLDHLQHLANAGNIEELEKARHGVRAQVGVSGMRARVCLASEPRPRERTLFSP